MNVLLYFKGRAVLRERNRRFKRLRIDQIRKAGTAEAEPLWAKYLPMDKRRPLTASVGESIEDRLWRKTKEFNIRYGTPRGSGTVQPRPRPSDRARCVFRGLRGRTREQPHSEKLWLAFAEFQDEFLAMNQQVYRHALSILPLLLLRAWACAGQSRMALASLLSPHIGFTGSCDAAQATLHRSTEAGDQSYGGREKDRDPAAWLAAKSHVGAATLGFLASMPERVHYTLLCVRQLTAAVRRHALLPDTFGTNQTIL